MNLDLIETVAVSAKSQTATVLGRIETFLPLGPNGVGRMRINGQRPLATVLALTLAVGAIGCGMVPTQRLDESRKLIGSLRTENAQLKDSTLSLRTQNQDLTQRAVDDARRIAALDEVKTRLERSVQGYIDEREEINTAFQQFKREAVAKIQSEGRLSR